MKSIILSLKNYYPKKRITIKSQISPQCVLKTRKQVNKKPYPMWHRARAECSKNVNKKYVKILFLTP